MSEPIYIPTDEDERIVVRSFVDVDDTISISSESLWPHPPGEARWLEDNYFFIPAAHLDAVIAALVRLREGT